ncbi:MAG: hypothetical protein EOO68_32670, partial [Moraxellaceae bacterium]
MKRNATVPLSLQTLSASAFYYQHMLLGAEFAGILGKIDDSVKYSKIADDIRHAIVNRFYVKGTGKFDNGTQSAQLFALNFDLSPDKG